MPFQPGNTSAFPDTSQGVTNQPANKTVPHDLGIGAAPQAAFTAAPLVDPNAYVNPVGNQAGNWNLGMQNMLGATTGQAPQMGYTNVGQAYQAGGGQVGPTSTYGGAQIQGNQYNQTFGAEGALANQLALQAQGQGPSVAQQVAQQQAQQNFAQQAALLGSQRGSSNPALAVYQAQQAGANAQQQAAQQAVLGRTQEVLGAQQNYGNLLGSMNQQAQGFATNQAQLTQQGQLASMGAINSQNLVQAQLGQQNQQFNVGNQNAMQQLQAQMWQQANQGNLGAAASQNALNAQQYNNYMSMLQQQNMAAYQAAMQQQAQMSSNALTQNGINAGVGVNQANNQMQLGGAGIGLVSGAGAIAAQAMSDKRTKKSIKQAHKELDRFLDQLITSPLSLSL